MPIKNNIHKDFLLPTIFCNSDANIVVDLARVLTKHVNTDQEKARTLFYWVRDEIQYRLGMWNRTVLETIAEKSGTCTNKANVLVAMLRSLGIPAGYKVMRVKGRDYFGPAVPPALRKHISEESLHVCAMVYLHDLWISVDPSDDKQLAESTYHFNPQSKIVEWDGKMNAMLNLQKDHIIHEQGPLSNIDAILDKKPHTARGAIVHIANLYLEFLRENGDDIHSIERLESLFRFWLRRQYKLYFVIYLALSVYYDIKNIKFSNLLYTIRRS